MSGIFDIINIPFGYVIRFCYWLTNNYALALLLFAIFVKLLLFPFGIKQQKNSVKQAALTPKTEAIRKKYAGRTDAPTQQKMNQEIMDLYKQENFNPASGCLPLLIQMPILLSLYQVVTNPLRYICNVGKDSIAAIGEKIIELGADVLAIPQGITLPAADKAANLTQMNILSILKVEDNFNTLLQAIPEHLEGLEFDALPIFNLFGHLGGIDLSATPSFKPITWLIIIPILSGLASYFGMKLTRKFSFQADTAATAAPSMKAMDLMMPLMSVFIAFGVPAVIGIYWIYQSILGVVQQLILSKMFPPHIYTPEELKKIEKEANAKAKEQPKKELKKVKSLHHIDDEDYDSLPEVKTTPEKKIKEEEGSAISKGVLKDESDRKKK